MKNHTNRNEIFSPDFQSYNTIRSEKLSEKSRKRDIEARNNKFRSFPSKLKKKKINHIKQNFLARQFMTECYLTSPHYINSDYLIIPRPSGKRCMILVHDGITTSFDKNGNLMKSYSPGILFSNSNSRGGIILLDCIYSENQDTYYALDLLCWKMEEFYEYPAESRFYFLQCYLSQCEISGLSIKTINIFEGNLEGLRNAYFWKFDYEKDGLIFYNKNSSYVLGINHDIMIWKDANCSLYALNNISEEIEIILFVKYTGELLTLDGFVLGSVDIEKYQLHHGNLVKCKIEAINTDIEQPAVIGLEFMQKASFRKGKADHWSKILYQYLSRNSPITFISIEEAFISNDHIDTPKTIYFGNYLYPTV
ncbi:unnamed protein product [Blepharisma stoltei]|uniref:Snurportin-1 n=1 Tax=Blepharisma stoltei TaxID=1481888 RepID=A0AAU9JW30_9CILI|nr:unnamed protein product [Blepharisma stoltei]